MVDQNKLGLSSANRSFIVTIFIVGLLLFGPVQPYGLAIRIAYLIALPTALWFTLPLLGWVFDIDQQTNDRIYRALCASIAGALFVAACLAFTAESHVGCTQYARVVDGGRECVGDTEVRTGPDYANGLLFLFLAGAAFWLSVSKRSDFQ